MRSMIGDRPLRDILESLYDSESRCQFSVLPAEAPGRLYEQFLGKLIRLTKGHRAKVHQNPKVRKAGGVYYTPAHIVDYIVGHTLGNLLGGKAEGRGGLTPAQAAKLRILDPACGSGSFLIGAYQRLLDWHRDRYLAADPEKHARGRNPRLYRGAAGDWRLTTGERTRILLNNVYGVDVDPQAVEVAKLSLLLKVLEGESKETANNRLRSSHERALPDLGRNVKCGNALIGPDFHEGRQGGLFDEEEVCRVNAFDWCDPQRGFGGIIQAGGFDAVLGNPPWLMAGYSLGSEIDYLRSRYRTAEGKFDLYYVFIELGIRLLKEDGQLGMIVPNKFFHTRAATTLRAQLARERMLHSVVDFGDEKVFAGATNYAAVILLRKRPSRRVRFSRARADLSIVRSYDVPWKDLGEGPWHFVEPRSASVFKKMDRVGTPLAAMVERFGTGVQSGADGILLVDAPMVRRLGLEKRALRPMLRGRDVRRYHLAARPGRLVFPYSAEGNEFSIYGERALRKSFPNAYAYLDRHRTELARRVWFGKSAKELSGRWYGMMYLDSRRAFSRKHLVTPSLSNTGNFALGDGSLFATGTAGVTSIIPNDQRHDILYFLGLLNSSLLSLYATRHSPVFQGGYYKFSAPYLKRLPIPKVDFRLRSDRARHDRMVESVQGMLGLHGRLDKIRTEREEHLLRRQIGAVDRKIDELVYELYGLTDEEIEIAEEAAAK